jgi:tetratricopeptide (TPR) repeat protein
MIKMYFHIQFRAQLRRTRPELIASLEDTVASSAVSAGGVVENGRKVLGASFDENSIGFWLDMVIFLEKACAALEKAVPELYGYALVLGRDITEAAAQKLCRLSAEKDNRELSGIWCSEEITDALEFYVVFGRLLGNKNGSIEGFRGIRGFKSFESYGKKFPHRERIKKALSLDRRKKTLLLGPEFSGIKDGIYHYCISLRGDVPPLVIRFGSGAHAFVCFVDAYTPELRSFIARAVPAALSGEELKKLDDLHGRLFRERLRDEWPPGTMAQCRFFVRSLLASYIAAAGILAQKAVLILEDLSLANESAGVFVGAYFSILSSIRNEKGKERILVFGADNLLEERIKDWEGVFDKILKFTPEDSSNENLLSESFWENQRESLPNDILEFSYCISIFARYFPVCLFPQLFEEIAINPDMYNRVLQMLSAMGVSVFETRSINLLNNLSEERMEKVHSKVRSLILSWVLSGKLRPCFNLLRILFELGGNAGDVLVLKSIKADVQSGTWKGIEQAITEECFASIVGSGNAPLLAYIYKTLKALVWGRSDEIRQAFQEAVPSVTTADVAPCYIGYQAQMQTNLTSFYIGSREINAASETVRGALLLNRDLKDDKVPAYRLFSVLNLSRQRIDDAMEYISFALEQAEKAGQQEEIFLACYFASSINLLKGNLSKSLRLAAKAEETAFSIEYVNWGMRAKFLRARLHFEIGRYNEALDIFKSIPSESGTDMERTVEAWIYRTKNFLNPFSALRENAEISGADAKIFEIEAAYFFSDYKRAETLAEEFLSSAIPPPDNFFFTEQPDWRSGFTQCEYMFQSDEKPGTRLVQIYRSMAQCALNLSVETRKEILGRMQRFMRDELLPDTDPSDTVYFYAWYRMLTDSLNRKDSPATQVDVNTVVSMAFKRLQRRASKIDDAEIKQAFLSLPRWNNALYQAAREHRLI